MPRTKGRPPIWTEAKVSSVLNQAHFHVVSLKTMCKHMGLSYNSFMAAKRKYYGEAKEIHPKP